MLCPGGAKSIAKFSSRLIRNAQGLTVWTDTCKSTRQRWRGRSAKTRGKRVRPQPTRLCCHLELAQLSYKRHQRVWIRRYRIWLRAQSSNWRLFFKWTWVKTRVWRLPQKQSLQSWLSNCKKAFSSWKDRWARLRLLKNYKLGFSHLQSQWWTWSKDHDHHPNLREDLLHLQLTYSFLKYFKKCLCLA